MKMRARWLCWWVVMALSACGGAGSADDDAPDGGSYPANVVPSSAPPLTCGATGAATQAVMADLNSFWQSRVMACSCRADAYAAGCTGNAFVLGGAGYGYIYYDANLLNLLDLNTGSSLPADMVLAHEFGHNIQLALGLPSSAPKYKELQADCLAGFYVGSRIRRGLATQAGVLGVFATACQIGDPTASPWWGHGTCNERVAALQSGIAGFLNGLLPGAACPSL